MSPMESVQEGLRDPALAFVKGESHPPRKLQTKTWRLIWCLSEVDRILDASVFTDMDKSDTLAYQCGPRATNGKVEYDCERPMELAVGVGHDDHNLQRTFFELQSMLERSADHKIRCSDATGWDMSVSSTSFWAGMEARLSRATSKTHYRTLLISGFFQSIWGNHYFG